MIIRYLNHVFNVPCVPAAYFDHSKQNNFVGHVLLFCGAL